MGSANKMKRCKRIDCKIPKLNEDGCRIGCPKCRLRCLKRITVVRTETKTNINFATEDQKNVYKKLDCLRAKVTRCEYTFVKIVKTSRRRLQTNDKISFNVDATYICDDDGDGGDSCTAAQQQLVTQPEQHSAEVASKLRSESAFQNTQ